MTKTEFRCEAGKAGIPDELYGATLAGSLYSDCFYGPVSGGKVVGIVWKNKWQTRNDYSPWRGHYEETSLGKEPYVVLNKNRVNYEVPAWRVMEYVNKACMVWLNTQVKANEPI